MCTSIGKKKYNYHLSIFNVYTNSTLLETQTMEDEKKIAEIYK